MNLHHVVLNSGLGYLDGGTGSMMLQAAIAGVLSMAFVIKSRWLMLKQSFLAKKKNLENS